MDGAVVTALVRGYLGDSHLSEWFLSEQVDIADLITWLGAERDRPDHARVVCDAVLQYLGEIPGNHHRQAVLSALRDHGYLAQALLLQHPDAPQYQLHAAYHLLRAAFGPALDRSTAEEILGGTQSAPTPALLGAVLLLLASRADARHVQRTYLAAQLKLTAFAPDMRARLESIASGRASASDRRVVEAPPQPGSPRPLAEPPEPPTALRDLREARRRPESPFKARRRGRFYLIPPTQDP
jgi:hypothetical protein